MRDLRDFRADWQRWTPNERIFSLLILPAILAITSLSYLAG
jgi:hypothetical protein